MEKYYNAQEDKIIIQPFVSRLPLIYNEKKDKENYNHYYDKLKLSSKKKILFYNLGNRRKLKKIF